MRSVTEDSFLNGAINADYEEISAVTKKVAERLNLAERVRVTSDKGTNLTLSVKGRSAFVFDGRELRVKGVNGLPTGEAAIAPLEGTAEGTLVIDYLIDGIGLLTEPVHLTVSNGRVVKVKGGPQAADLQRIFDSDPNANNIAELAIGTNPVSRMLGNAAEDKVRRGSIHIGLGDNSKTLQGTVPSTVHIDATVYKPSVWLDDYQLVADGVLRI